MTSRRTSPIIAMTLVCLLCILCLSCAGVGSFSFSEESEEIFVDASPLGSTPLGNLFPNARIPMEVNLEEELAEQDASGARAVYLRELYFELSQESEKRTFDFLDDITISVASRQEDSELAEATLAWRDPIPEGQERFYLDLDDELDLKTYAEEGIRLNTQVTGSAPADDARFQVYATFRVRVL